MKRITTIAIILFSILTLTACTDGQFAGQFTIDDIEKLWGTTAQDPDTSADTASDTESAEPYSDDNATITIASWNIKWISHQKAGDELTGPIITHTLAQFDIIAIQEIRDTTDKAMNILEQSLADLGHDYDWIIGPLLPEGERYRERYAIIYNTATIEQVKGTKDHTYPDTAHDFDREPYSAHFKAKNGTFDFVLVSIHTAPKKAADEIGDLTDAITDAKNHFGEPDVITVGDYNADCYRNKEYYVESRLETDFPTETYTIIIPNEADTNLASSDCTYDRIIITKSADEDYTGTAGTTGNTETDSWGVYHFDEIHNMPYDKAKKVSDHYPVWAQFHIDQDSD